MALTQVTGPYPIFTDLDGTPLDDGYLYIGEINEDPETNPIQVYWDSALTIVATQPIRTNSGYAYRNGSPALLYTAGEFSITIRNKRQEFVLYSPVGYGFDPAAVSASVVQNDFIGDGVEVDFTLSASPSTKLATSVFINGVYQEKDSYSISGNVLTFTIAPPLNSSIEIMTNETGVIGSTNASLVSYTAGFTGAVAQTVQTKLEQYVSVKDFGAVGDGITDDTAAIQSAATALTQGQTLYFPAGQYLIGQVIFDGKSNIAVSAYGARFTLTGNNAGFLVKGVCSNISVLGGTITGDGVNRDASPSTAQIGWMFGNETGAFVQNVFVRDVIVDSANIGFKFAAGTGGGSGNTNFVKIAGCQAKDIVGLVGGIGYGFQFSQAPNSVISDCVAINCGRHGIYFAEGRNYAATNCVIKDHRSTVFTGAYRVAMSISRSRNVAVSNCVFDNCFDGTIAVDVDTGGTAPDNVSYGTAITNCTFLNSELADIRIGTVPAVDGTVYNVSISNCVIVRKSGNTVKSIIVEGGERIKITDNLIDATAAPAGYRAIGLNATSGATYTNDVEIVRNTINSPEYGVEIESALQTGTSRVRVMDNKIVATTAELLFVGGENITTNNNLIYNRTSGKNSLRVYSSSGSNVIIPVGGLDELTLSASGATTIANFSGGLEGQELTLYFTNGNTTLLNTNFYTAGALNFTGTASDTLTMVYMGGFWREKCRSIN
jgi:hypothetical protein